jgi:hypothetical protein
MPHSPGVYVALVLGMTGGLGGSKDGSAPNGANDSKKSSSSAVRRMKIKNGLFLDLESLSKNVQTILKYAYPLIFQELPNACYCKNQKNKQLHS